MHHDFSYHVGVLDREGSHQLIVDPVTTAEGGAYVLSSRGRSRYVQEEVAYLSHDASLVALGRPS